MVPNLSQIVLPECKSICKIKVWFLLESTISPYPSSPGGEKCTKLGKNETTLASLLGDRVKEFEW